MRQTSEHIYSIYNNAVTWLLHINTINNTHVHVNQERMLNLTTAGLGN